MVLTRKRRQEVQVSHGRRQRNRCMKAAGTAEEYRQIED